MIAEVLILILGLLLAILRSLPGPVFFPLRLIATIYADVFRALPGVLVIYIPRVRDAGPRIDRDPQGPLLLGDRLADADLQRLRLRGLSGRDRIDSPQPGCRRPIARAFADPVAALRDRWPQAHSARGPALLNDFIGSRRTRSS